jgi:hypothetical protein
MSRMVSKRYPETINSILEMMQSGKSLRNSCEAHNVSSGAFMLWVSEDRNLAEQYKAAREAMIDKIADDTVALADADPERGPDGKVDSGWVSNQRLKIDTRKWLLSKLAPKKYGDRIEVSGDADNPLKIERIERVVVGEVIEQRALSKKVEDDA